MTTSSNPLTYVVETPADDSFGLPPYEGEESLVPLPEEFLTEPNLDDVANQTLRDQGNGNDSNTRDTRLGDLPFDLPLPRPPQIFFNALQKWEGVVTEVRQDTFLSRLVPMVGEGSDQEAEIYVEEIDQEDRELIELGAVFYWTIGYLDRPSGRMRASAIRFRRLPVWTRRELQIAKIEAAKLKSLLDVE